MPPTQSQILWAIDSELDDHRFERLCTDLLSREGYQDIVPVGGQRDHGRDAELRIYRGTHHQLGTIFFQYSLDGRWQRKLEQELSKVERYGHTIDTFIFVTSRRVTGERRDRLKQRVRANFGWNLEIYEREWLRHRLEEAHPDLVTRHLGLGTSTPAHSAPSPITPPKNLPQEGADAWRLFGDEQFELATPHFQQLVREAPKDRDAWKALSWCHYSTLRYRDGLSAIRVALALDPEDSESLSIKACILTEDGISSGSRAGILQAKEIFGRITAAGAGWIDFYNYGNALHALGEHEDARQMFVIATEMAPTEARAWKNLGTVYFHLGDHQKELECYDLALELEPDRSEALCSKAVTYIIRFERHAEARTLLEQARAANPEIELHWPHYAYWLSRSALQSGDVHHALRAANAGLELQPSAEGLLNLKTEILGRLWRQDLTFGPTARAHLNHVIAALGDTSHRTLEWGRLELAVGNTDAVYEVIAKRYRCTPDEIRACHGLTAHSLSDLLESVHFLPLYEEYRRQYPIPTLIENLGSRGVGTSLDFETSMKVVCCIPFALACTRLVEGQSGDRIAVASAAFDVVGTSLIHSMPKLAHKLLEHVERDSIEGIAEGLSFVMVSWPDEALREISRVYAFAGGRLGYSTEELDHGIDSDRPGDWWGTIVEETLKETNKVLHFAREDEAAD